MNSLKVNPTVICKGFINCDIPEEEHQNISLNLNNNFNEDNSSEDNTVNKIPYIKTEFLSDNVNLKYNTYTLIEKRSGLPLMKKNLDISIAWGDEQIQESSLETPTHYTFFPFKAYSENRIISDNHKTILNTEQKYLITTISGERTFLLSRNYKGGVYWAPVDNELQHIKFSPLIGWRFNKDNKINQKIKEGDFVSIVAADNDHTILSKEPFCDLKNNAKFGMIEKKKISPLDSVLMGQGEHDFSIPVCKYKDCENECLLFEFQILGTSYTINSKLTTSNLQSNSEEVEMNRTTMLYGPIYGVGFAILSCFLLGLIVFLYYWLMPAKYDIISTFHLPAFFKATQEFMEI